MAEADKRKMHKKPQAAVTDKIPSKPAEKKEKKSDVKRSTGVSAPLPVGYIPRLKQKYKDTVVSDLVQEFGYTSVMQAPRFVKIVVSMGVGEAKENKKFLDSALSDLTLITGQQPIKTRAKKSIATFKIRQGQEIGARVTLRGKIMWEFLDRLLNVALPRVKDFRGLNPGGFDGRGNYSLGLTEQIIFPEIDFDKIEKIRGLNIAIVTTSKNDKEARSLLVKMGMPFKK